MAKHSPGVWWNFLIVRANRWMNITYFIWITSCYGDTYTVRQCAKIMLSIVTQADNSTYWVRMWQHWRWMAIQINHTQMLISSCNFSIFHLPKTYKTQMLHRCRYQICVSNILWWDALRVLFESSSFYRWSMKCMIRGEW